MPFDTKTLKYDSKLSKRLKARFDKDLERKEAKAEKQKQKQQKKKSKQAADDQEHVDENAPLKGILGKGDRYAERAHDYIEGLDGRGVYRFFDFPYHTAKMRKRLKTTCEFPQGPPRNFNPPFRVRGKKAGQKYPYPWEAHHMIPGAAFYAKTEEGTAFTEKQLTLVLQSDYNINHGHNMIMLPDLSAYVPCHSLLQHPGDHKAYTMKVMSHLKEVAQDLQKLIDKEKPHETLVADVFEELKGIETDLWKFIVSLSRACVAAKYAGTTFDDEHVRYAPETGDSTYKWGALW